MNAPLPRDSTKGWAARKLYGAEVSVILETVARAFDVTPEQLLGKLRTSDIVLARHVTFYVARHVTGFSYPVLGYALGRDHTTIIHSEVLIAERRKVDDALDAVVVRLMDECSTSKK